MSENFQKQKNKISYLQYVITPKGISERTKLTINFMKRKIKEYDELKKELEDKNFKTNLNLIQTYKSLSIAEGMRLEPNNPVFLLKGKK